MNAAILGPVLGEVAGELVKHFLENNEGDGGLLGGLGDMVGKIFDPLGLFGGQEKQGMSEDAKEMMEMMRDMISELMVLVKEQNSEGSEAGSESQFLDNAQGAGQAIQIDAGSGDDIVTIG